ncbi:Protein csh3 [Mycena venus]|uniref:Protein csh3 n=1 Tax=Mycena venus TaxID=2733690 RepID=A0A8H7CAL9_9AGAR|nr:Protein csh3 [Mycena venus]
MSEAALLAHVVSQVESNVNFLVSQNYISQADASVFLAKLPSSSAPAAMPVPTPYAPRRQVSASAAPAVVQARALWPYNETGQDADDLSFSAGDIIEVVKEENADWWMGRFNGKQALFPSAYVEKIAAPTAPAPAAPARRNRSWQPIRDVMHLPRPEAEPIPWVYSRTLNKTRKSPSTRNTATPWLTQLLVVWDSGAGAAIGGGLVRAIF